MTAQGILGEVLGVGYCLRTPTATEWTGGQAIDAGTAQILDSNLSHLARENLHHLVTAFGPGNFGSNYGRGYSSLLDAREPSNPTALEEISWARTVSACFGPFDLCGDRIESTGNEPRSVVVRIDAVGGGVGTLTLYAALTQDEAVPSDTSVLAWLKATATSGRARNQLTLDPARHPLRSQRSRSSPSEASQWSAAYLWVGWYGTDAGDSVVGISAWERR